MFKKIEVWILYLTIIISILFALAFGVLVRQETEGITKVGSIDIGFLTKPAAYIARLPESLLLQIFKSNPNLVNDAWDENRDFYNDSGFIGIPNNDNIYLLLSRYDGDQQEGVVELIDLRTFEISHSWNPDIDKFNSLVAKKDEFKNIERDFNNYRSKLMHPMITEDGGLIFNEMGAPLRKVDACNNLVFQNTNDSFHHSIEIDDEGNIWVPSYKYPHSLPTSIVGKSSSFRDDTIVKLSKDGEILYEKPVSQIFIENGFEYLLFGVGDRKFIKDPIHLNDIQPVNIDSNYWKKGDLFISPRNQSMVFLFRPSTGKIIWHWSGPFFQQHDIDILDDKRISIYNNNVKNFHDGFYVDGNNEVIIYDFETEQYSYYLNESLLDQDVRTPYQGRSEILPNGDMFIEETDFGRTLYYNSDGSLRWYNVNKAENQNVYRVGWSRILHKKEDVAFINKFLRQRNQCNE